MSNCPIGRVPLNECFHVVVDLSLSSFTISCFTIPFYFKFHPIRSLIIPFSFLCHPLDMAPSQNSSSVLKHSTLILLLMFWLHVVFSLYSSHNLLYSTLLCSIILYSLILFTLQLLPTLTALSSCFAPSFPNSPHPPSHTTLLVYQVKLSPEVILGCPMNSITAVFPHWHCGTDLTGEVVRREQDIQYNTIQYNTIQYNTIQYNTIQYNTIQYNTIQYNTIQYNKI